MEVYSCPDEIPAPEIYFSGVYDFKAVLAAENEHEKNLCNWLKENGYTGKNTGKIVAFGVGDGCAQYMLAEGRKSILIHLPYGDAYQYPDVRFLPKREILRRAR